MKLLITTLTFMFISFEVLASSMGQLYQFCTILKNNNYSVEGLDSSNKMKASMCASKFSSYATLGYRNCQFLRYAVRKNKITKESFIFLSQAMALGPINAKKLIPSFLIYMNMNPEFAKESTTLHLSKYGSKVFPCKMK